MGTRNLTIVALDGQYKVAQYGQWDGYPEGQGQTALTFLHKLSEMSSSEQGIFTEKIRNLTWITEEEIEQQWVSAGAEPNSQFVNMAVSDRFAKLHPENSRDIGAEILQIILDSPNPLKLQNSIDFAADSLMCEWAYVVDLDRGTFEVYKGFNKNRLDLAQRFAGLPFEVRADSKYPGFRQYYQIRFVKSYPLTDLPGVDEFVKEITHLTGADASEEDEE